MRIPVRLSLTHVPPPLRIDGLSAGAPSDLYQPKATSEFLRAVSSLRFGRFFKTTSHSRLPLLLHQLIGLDRAFDCVADIGASDGSASLDFIKGLKFNRYLLIDRNLHVFLRRQKNRFLAYDSQGRLIMYQRGPWLVYVDSEDAWRTPGERIATALLRKHRFVTDLTSLQKVTLVNPEVEGVAEGKVEALEHDITKAWTGAPCDLVIIANLLNKMHDDPALTRAAASTVAAMLGAHGVIAVAENSPDERGSLIERDGNDWRVSSRYNNGSASEHAFLEGLRCA